MPPRFLSTLVAPLALIATQAADPQITNVTASQRPGTYLVDISYNLIDTDSPTVYVFAEISVDGGNNYSLPGFPVFGDVGHLVPGLNKRIEWNAWVNWGGNFTDSAKVRLTAVETRTIVPEPVMPPPNPRMAWIPAGTFARGARNVWISQGFWIGKYEVTQSEYQSLIGSNPSAHVGPDRPVERVTWQEANAYCQQLTMRDRAASRLPAEWEYRLPTEAQWEYACRGGTNTDHFFGAFVGTITLHGFAWFGSNSPSSHHVVGEKGPNPYALYDIYGNVNEMTLDGFSPLQDGYFMDPFAPKTTTEFIYRGGSWRNPWNDINSGFRAAAEDFSRFDNLGFRVVAVQVP